MQLTEILMCISSVICIIHMLLWRKLNEKLECVHPVMFHGNVIWPFRKQTFRTRMQDKLGYYYYWTLRHPKLSEWPYALFIITLLLDIFM